MTRSKVEAYLEQALLHPEATKDARKQSGRELHINSDSKGIFITAYNSQAVQNRTAFYERMTDDGHQIYMTVEQYVNTGVDWIPIPLWNWLYDGRKEGK